MGRGKSHNDDLVTGILGVQVHPRASTVEWTSGQKTVVPFLPKRDKKRRLRNILENDARYVKDLAKLPAAGPSSSQVSFLDKNTRELFKHAHEALSQDKVVVVRDYVNTHGFEFNTQDLDEHFGVAPNRPVQAHGRLNSSPLFACSPLFRYGLASRKLLGAPRGQHRTRVRA